MAPKYTETFNRIANRAYMYDNKIKYDGEALMLALLLHTTGTAQRSKNDLEQVGRMLNDPNIDKKPARRYRK